MYKTAKGMIQNFFYIIKKYSFIPNGGRIYYLKRSQPALLTSMVDEYFTATNDIDFLFDAMPILETELSFWEKRRTVNVTVNGNNYVVFQYRADSNVPRPESYFQDVNTTKNIKGCDKKREIWKSISSTAESGWDFSTRFLSNYSEFSSFQTTDIVEVDINAILCSIYGTISKLYRYMDYSDKSKEFDEKYNKFMKTFKEVFYNPKRFGWFDYNIKNQKYNFEYYASNLSPLYWKCFGSDEEKNIPLLYKNLESKGIFNFRGGLPSSLIDSKQQWDLPNGWSPSNHMVIMGLSRINNTYLQNEALNLAKRWILSNYRTFKKEKAMFEKYNVVSESIGRGGGGEYDVQEGFGWTNGVILDLLTKYNNNLTINDLNDLCDLNLLYYKLYDDPSKLFSRPLKYAPQKIANIFFDKFKFIIDSIDMNDLSDFVEESFEKENSELKRCDEIEDWSENVDQILAIKNETYREWGKFLHNRWKNLCYQFDEDVKDHPIKYSSIYLPNKFIASDIILEGNRLWDTYYIVKGLLASQMYDTAKGMIENLVHLVDIYGYLPFGYRIYHLKKTTIPLLTLTVNLYYQCTKDLEFLKKVLPTLEKEFLFWEKERSVNIQLNGKNYTGFQYRTSLNVPRLENFYSDYDMANHLKDCDQKRDYWRKLQTISESSEISYRWVNFNNSINATLDTNILPIELNSILCNASGIIANFHKLTKNINKLNIFKKKYIHLKKSFKAIFYNTVDEIWYDFNLTTFKHNKRIYTYSFFPVFLKCYDKEEEGNIVYMYERIKRLKFHFSFAEMKEPYIMRTTQNEHENLYYSINQMIIEGLFESKNIYLINEGKKIMNRLLERGYKFFQKYYTYFPGNNSTSFEKKRALSEYGFVKRLSLANGIILDYLVKYGNEIQNDSNYNNEEKIINKKNITLVDSRYSDKYDIICTTTKPKCPSVSVKIGKTFGDTIYIMISQISKMLSKFFIYII
ncbi:Trehalase [Strongyloides ratti]|uniref:Trehalase n=1 Tax=Strongyloides ratti TaxID=34506 RepID=A0A090LBJ2_STRRB|nr:Trehalase [Strongyloides ratti]CEF67136.1 Trehalase [Strongyloides ratti]